MDFKKVKKPDLSKIKKPDLSKIEVPDIDIDDEKVAGFFKNKKVLGLISVIVIILISCGFYFLYWIRRPEYSIDIIRKAVAMRDVNTFNRHVDLNAIYDKLFEDATYGVGDKADEFSRVIATGLNKKDRKKIVERFGKVTLSSFEKKQEEREDLHSFGVIGRAVSIVCDNFEANNPAYVYVRHQVISKKDNEAIVRFFFLDVEKRKNIVIDFLMKELSDGKWKIVNMMNIRSTYQSAEYIFNEGLEKKLKEEAERNAKLAAERERAYDSFVVLSEEKRKEASFEIWKFFRKKIKPIEDSISSMFRFISTSYADGKGKPAMSIYNDFVVSKDTGIVKNTAALVLTSSDKDMVDFDKIYFTSPSGGFVIDTALWQQNDLGALGALKRDEWRRYSMVFLTTTDGLGDVYKLLSKGNLRILFYKGSTLLVAFDADEKMRQSISDAVYVNDLVKNKLRTENSNYVIFPLTEAMLADIDKQLAEEALKEKDKPKSIDMNEKDNKDKVEDSNTVKQEKDVKSTDKVETNQPVKQETPVVVPQSKAIEPKTDAEKPKQ